MLKLKQGRIQIVWLLFLIICSTKVYSLSYEYIPCRNPFILHDVYYGINNDTPTAFDIYMGNEEYKCGVPKEDLKQQYENYILVEELRNFELYPNTYQGVYDRVLKNEEYKESPLFKGNKRYFDNFNRLMTNLLKVEGIKDLEELKHLAKTRGSELLKGDELYFYKFPKDYFEEGDDHVVFTMTNSLYGKLAKKELDQGLVLYKFGSPTGEIVPLEDAKTPYFKRNIYFDYSLFLNCLGSDRLSECIEHNFIFTAYLLSMFSENDLSVLPAKQGMTGQEAAEYYSDGESGNYESFLASLKNNIMVLKKELLLGYTEDDFRIYLKRGSENGRSEYVKRVEYKLARNAKRDLQNKMNQIAFFGETEDNKLTRQDKFLHIYFNHFLTVRPDFIKKNEYVKVSRFYYGQEDIYKSLYDLMEDQKIPEMESPLFYSVLYYQLIFLKEVLGVDKDYTRSTFEIEVKGQKYTQEELPKICNLYHESLDKALQGATEERRKAFEAKNIKVCEM